MGIWADSYQPAVLNGVPFLVSSETTPFGRRTDVAQSPGSDAAQFVDLGKSAKAISVTAFFVGPSYDTQRNAFLQAISGPGPYHLIHPHYGPMFVVIPNQGARVQHTDSQGGRASLNLQMVNVSIEDFTQRLDTTQAVTVAVDELDVALEEFPPTLPSNDPNLLEKLQDLGLIMEQIEGRIAARLNVVDQVTSAVQAFSDGIETLASTPNTMMTRIVGLNTAVFGLFKVARDLGPDVQLQEALDQTAVLMESVTDVGTFAIDELFIPPIAESAKVDHRNRRGLNAGIRLAGLGAAARQLVEMPLDSATQALELQRRLVDLFAGAREPDLSREVTEASRRLEGAVSQHLREVAATLPQITTYTPDRTVPAILVAYRVHGDPERFAEIVRRNGLRYPNFVPPEPVEVKRDPPQV